MVMLSECVPEWQQSHLQLSLVIQLYSDVLQANVLCPRFPSGGKQNLRMQAPFQAPLMHMRLPVKLPKSMTVTPVVPQIMLQARKTLPLAYLIDTVDMKRVPLPLVWVHCDSQLPVGVLCDFAG